MSGKASRSGKSVAGGIPWNPPRLCAGSRMPGLNKINPAAFGNIVQNLHWHITPRCLDDRHFPESVWGSVQREARLDVPEIDNATLSPVTQQAPGAVNTDGIFHEH